MATNVSVEKTRVCCSVDCVVSFTMMKVFDRVFFDSLFHNLEPLATEAPVMQDGLLFLRSLNLKNL